MDSGTRRGWRGDRCVDVVRHVTRGPSGEAELPAGRNLARGLRELAEPFSHRRILVVRNSLIDRSMCRRFET